VALIIIEAAVEVVIEIFLEVGLQVVAEVLVELGVRRGGGLTRRSKSNPLLAAIGYALLGLAIGGLSAWLWPHTFISDELRWINLAVTPIIAGLTMALIGVFVRRRGKETIRLESFVYGWLFAFSFSLVRVLSAG
jgi:hypothetical protein